MIKFNKQSRRHFIVGMGGSVITLPILSSLCPKAYANETDNEKCLFLLWSPHGGAGSNFLLPPGLQSPLGPYNTLTEQEFLPASNVSGNIAPAHKIHYSDLVQYLHTDPISGNQQFSHIIGPKLSVYLNKMIIARGIDIPGTRHGHINGMWGNFKASTNSFDALHPQMTATASIDQLLAYSPKFYSTFQLNNLVRQRVTNIASSNSYDAVGNALNSYYVTINSIYSNLFGAQIQSQASKKLAIDNILTDFNRLSNPSNALGSRLSTTDRNIIQQFGNQLFEVQRRLNSIANCSATNPGTPTYVHGPQYNSKAVIPANWDEMYDAIAQAVALAFTCGSTRIVGSGLNLNLFGDSDYHQNVAHALNNPAQAQIHADGMRYIADEFIASLAQKLDAIATSDDKTMLDKTAIVWGHEHNIDETHYTFDLPLVVVGGFDGAIQKNKFVDFRNLDSLAIKTSPTSTFRPGILLNQVLANFLRAAGLSRSDFERTYTSSGGIVMPGYGDTYIQRGVGSHRDNYGQTAYPPNLLAQMSEPLPHFANFAA